MPLDTEIEIGVLGRPHGVRGASSLFLHNPQSPLIDELEVLIAESPDGRERVQLTVRSVPKGRKGARTLITDEVSDRDEAAALTGHKVLIPKALLPELQDPGEFYYHELPGLPVLTRSGLCVGTVVRVMWTSVDVLVVRLEAGGELMIPVVEAYVCEVDATRQVTVVDDVVELLTP